MREKKTIRRDYPVPAWAFLAVMAVYHELILHLWVPQPFHAGRFLAVTLFAVGFGAVLGLLVSFIPSGKAAKWTAVGVSVLLTVLYLTEYFVFDAYKTFMTLGTVTGGAEGVAQDYLDIVLSLLARNLWRIGLMLLPPVLYAVFCQPRRVQGWKLRAALGGSAAALYLLGMGAVQGLTPDAAILGRGYGFDSAVRSFGLHMGLILEARNNGGGEGSGSAEILPVEEMPTLPPQTQPPETGEPEGETEPPIVYGDNVLPGVDLSELAEASGNSAIKNIYAYAAARRPSKQNAYTGLFAGKNLILITAEAFTQEVIDPERTPTLYRLANQGIRFTEFYQPAWGASTTSGEFSNLTGLVPTNGGACMKVATQQKLIFTMGYQLQRLGYHSSAYHNHFASFYDRDKTHTHLGYDSFQARYMGLDDITPVWPESDLEMIDQTLPQYIDKQPFSVYYMTVSGHCPYSYSENAQTRRHIDEMQSLNHSDTVKGYFASQQELELAMASLVRQLEEAGIADDTVIVLSTDHYPYGLERSKTWQNTRDHLAELYGVENYDNFTRDHNALILWSGCLEGKNIVVDEPVYSLDILPTLSNLFGVEYDSRLMVGRDVFSGEPPLVLWPDRSWITDRGRYNSRTGVFTPTGGEADEDYIQQVSDIVANKIQFSRSVIERDFFNYLARDIGR